MSRLGGLFGHVEVLCGSFRVASALGRSPRGGSVGKEPKPKTVGSSTPGTPVINQQGAADRRRLRRITAAPCLFGSAYVAERWARACPNYRTMCSPSRCGKPSGNTWERRRRGRIRKKEEEEASWGTLMASWDLPGGLLEASWGPPSASWGPLGASWAPLWQS